MTGPRHEFVSPRVDGPDSSVVRPSNWNAQHLGVGALAIFSNSGSDTTSSGADTNFDDVLAGAATVSFVVPPSGIVIVNMAGIADVASGFTFFWALRRTSDNTLMGERILKSGGTGVLFVNMPIFVGSLTPGVTETWKWSQRTDGGGTLTTKCVLGISMEVHPVAS